MHFKDCQIRQHPRERANLSLREGYHAYHHNCGCSQRRSVRVLRVCQQIYVEVQPYLLLNSMLAFHRGVHPYPLERERDASAVPLTGQSVTAQLKAFYQRYLCSSLSGLKPITHLRRLQLTIPQMVRETLTALSFIRACKWDLDLLEINWQFGILFNYTDSWFLDSRFFESISSLRNVKRIAFHCTAIAHVTLFTEHQQGEGQDRVRLDEYKKIVTRAFSELTSRPREEGMRNRASMHSEAKAIFSRRLQQLMAEAGLSFWEV
jgi:hypothetical protein